MGHVREEMLCYLQGQERADGSFLFITASTEFCSLFFSYVSNGASGMQVSAATQTESEIRGCWSGCCP